MVYVKDELFPRCIIVVVREALVALGDVPIGAHLQKDGGRSKTGGGVVSYLLGGSVPLS